MGYPVHSHSPKPPVLWPDKTRAQSPTGCARFPSDCQFECAILNRFSFPMHASQPTIQTKFPIACRSCPICGKDMRVTRITPERPGFEQRTFECATCGDETVLMNPIRYGRETHLGTPDEALWGAHHRTMKPDSLGHSDFLNRIEAFRAAPRAALGGARKRESRIMTEYIVGLRQGKRSEVLTIEAEDALIAALKVKHNTPRP